MEQEIRTRANGIDPLRRVMVLGQTHYLSVPLDIIRKYGIRPGDDYRFSYEDDKLVLSYSTGRASTLSNAKSSARYMIWRELSNWTYRISSAGQPVAQECSRLMCRNQLNNPTR